MGTCTFSVEITPCIKHGSIHYLKYDRPGMTYKWSPRKSKPNGDTEMVQLEDSQSNKTKFKDIDTQLEYTFRVCTLLMARNCLENWKLSSLKKLQKNNKNSSSLSIPNLKDLLYFIQINYFRSKIKNTK